MDGSNGHEGRRGTQRIPPSLRLLAQTVRQVVEDNTLDDCPDECKSGKGRLIFGWSWVASGLITTDLELEHLLEVGDGRRRQGHGLAAGRKEYDGFAW